MKFQKINLLVTALLLLSSVAKGEEKKDNKYQPTLFGAVRAKYEQSVITNDHRFNVRNSRLGVKGFATEKMRYAVQIDFNNEGKVSILDSYVAYKMGNFEFSLGQQQYHFSRDLDRGPSSSLFSNRTFLAKYLTTYFGSTLVNGKEVDYARTIGSRDIGALITYKFPESMPASISAGLFNGSGANNPEWTNRVNTTARLMLGRETGFSGAFSFYTGTTPTTSRVMESATGELTQIAFNEYIDMWGGELRYASKNFLIEAEYAQRNVYLEGTHTIHAAHVHSYYRFDMKKDDNVSYLAPHLRWDIGRGVEFINQQSHQLDRYNANRISAALNIGLSEKWMRSELRLSYEEYILDGTPSDFTINPLLQDKFTVEFVVNF